MEVGAIRRDAVRTMDRLASNGRITALVATSGPIRRPDRPGVVLVQSKDPAAPVADRLVHFQGRSCAMVEFVASSAG